MENRELMERHQNENNSFDANGLLLVGGIALLVVGAGLITSHPAVRKYLGQVGLGDLVQAAVPDVERYLKLRAM